MILRTVNTQYIINNSFEKWLTNFIKKKKHKNPWKKKENIQNN